MSKKIKQILNELKRLGRTEDMLLSIREYHSQGRPIEELFPIIDAYFEEYYGERIQAIEKSDS